MIEIVEKSEFEMKLEDLINKTTQEKESDTPDFILAQFLSGCLDNFNRAINRREDWYGRK